MNKFLNSIFFILSAKNILIFMPHIFLEIIVIQGCQRSVKWQRLSESNRGYQIGMKGVF